jgi:hypothetical protein
MVCKTTPSTQSEDTNVVEKDIQNNGQAKKDKKTITGPQNNTQTTKNEQHELYEKRDNFDFSIVNLLFIYNNIQTYPVCGVYMLQLI